MNQAPYVFVVGCQRSGTTLLQRMLDNHPQLTVANDTHFITRIIEKVLPQEIPRIETGFDPPLTPVLIEKVLDYHRFNRLGLAEQAVREAAARASTYGQFVTMLYREFGKLHAKPLAGEKTPDYVRHLPLLHSLFPWVRTIHIIRDGRDTALSLLEWAREEKGPGRLELWREEPVAVCALWWRWHVSTGIADGRNLGPTKYREVRYEELVANPEKTLRDLVAFLDLPFSPEMLAYYEGKTRHNPRLSAKSAWLPPTPGLRDWHKQMKEKDLALFEAIAGDFLSFLGYERGVDRISSEITQIAERCEKWWQDEFKRQHVNLHGISH